MDQLVSYVTHCVGLWNAVFSACENTFVNMGFGGTSVTVLEESVLRPVPPAQTDVHSGRAVRTVGVCERMLYFPW